MLLTEFYIGIAVFAIIAYLIICIFPASSPYIIGTILTPFVIALLSMPLIMCIDQLKLKRAKKLVEKIMPNASNDTKNYVTFSALYSRNKEEFINAYANVNKALSGKSDTEIKIIAESAIESGNTKGFISSYLDNHLSFPGASVDAICFVIKEIMAESPKEWFISYEKSIKMVHGDIEFYLDYSTSSGYYWSSKPPIKRDVQYFAKDKDAFKKTLKGIQISDDDLNDCASLMYFNWHLVSMNELNKEVTLIFERRGVSMKRTFPTITADHVD